jgi:tetratricopeptide (TPR) repeat protein
VSDDPEREEIRHLRRTLDETDPETQPQEWASAQFLLGAALLERVVRGAEADVEPAIRCFEAARGVWTRENSPRNWCLTTFNLGNCYLQHPGSDRSDNVERVVECYEAALSGTDRADRPRLWADLHDALGQAYRQRLADAAENREAAIKHFELALEERDPTGDVLRYARTHNNVANAYLDRLRGEPADNIDRAIEHFRKALRPLEKGESLTFEQAELVATIHQNLGLAYGDRTVGDPERNRRHAIGHLERALAIRAREAVPFRWADSMSNLASIYLGERFRGTRERPDDVERAIACLEQALEIQTRRLLPDQWAINQVDLGLAFQERHYGEPESNIRSAIRHLRAALRVRTRRRDPLAWAETTEMLGNAFTKLPGDAAAERRAAACYRRTLQVYSDALPVERRRTLRNLGHLRFERGRWRKAVRAYRRAIELGALVMGRAYTGAGRRAEAAEASRVYPNMAYALACLGRYGEALTVLEQGKARLLSEVLSLTDAALARLPEAERSEIQRLRESLRALEAELKSQLALGDSTTLDRLRDRLGSERTALQARLKTIRAAAPDLLSAGLSSREILRLVRPGECLVAPLLTAHACAVSRATR